MSLTKLSLSLAIQGAFAETWLTPRENRFFPEHFFSAKKSVTEKLTQKKTCPECQGKCASYKHKHHGIECPTCKGSGGI